MHAGSGQHQLRSVCCALQYKAMMDAAAMLETKQDALNLAASEVDKIS